MRILVCPTAFKGTLTADEASRAMARGARSALPDAEIVRQPLSDGGPGLLDALRCAMGSGGGAGGAELAPDEPARASGDLAPARFEVEEVTVPGPLGNPVLGRILWRSGSRGPEAVLESADACGLALVPPERRDPLRGDTRGVGALIRRAEANGASAVRVGLGGSGTVDGGTGAARAFGWRFLDAEGRELPPGGGALERLDGIEAGRRPTPEITALVDVDHPLVGPRGAARTFAPQKGADPDEVLRLERGLERLDARVEADLGLSVGNRAGGGAAGGLAAGLAAFLGAELVPGAEYVLREVGFERLVADADVVVTGEGAFDPTSLEGKVVGQVCRRARARNVPVLLVCGHLETTPPDGVRACGPTAPGAGGGGRTLGVRDLAERTADCLQEFAASS